MLEPAGSAAMGVFHQAAANLNSHWYRTTVSWRIAVPRRVWLISTRGISLAQRRWYGGAHPMETTENPQSRLIAALSYLLGFITGIVFLFVEPYAKDDFVRFHARQSIVFSVAWIA